MDRASAAATPESSPPKPALDFRHVFAFPTLLVFALFAFLFMFSRTGISDPDIWWHLRNAEHLFQQHQLPNHDTYSFTVAGHPWIDHEWLAEIPYYLAWRAFGLSGIQTVMFLLLCLIFLGTLYLCWKESGVLESSLLACVFAALLATVSFAPRTILFGYLYLTILLVILQHFRQTGSASPLLIPPLFLLWINSHGSWLLGMIVFAAIIVAGLIGGSWGSISATRWTPAQRNKLIGVWLASAALLFVNPYGFRLVAYPFDLALRQKLNINNVAEWNSVNFHQARGGLVLLLLAILLLGVLLRRLRLSLGDVAIFLFALYLGLTYSRFLFLLGIIAAPVLAKILDFLPRFRRDEDTPLVNAVAILLIIAGMVYFWPSPRDLERIVADQYPVDVLPLSAAQPAPPRLNFYLWGGYLAWHDRAQPNFIDGRADIFEYAGVFQDYLDLVNLKHPKPILEKYHIQSVLFPTDAPLTYLLQHDPEWKTVYEDGVCVLLERSRPSPPIR